MCGNRQILLMKILSLFLLGSIFISACNRVEEKQVTLEPTAITPGDECHLCGMIIRSFPGPKGQAFIRHRAQPLKFCSTVDLFSWLLQPETEAILQTAFVHDMGQAPSWDSPSDKHYVKATEAWYVVNHQRKGAMGHTLASFRHRQDAELFIKQYGGRVLRYEKINLKLLASLQQSSH